MADNSVQEEHPSRDDSSNQSIIEAKKVDPKIDVSETTSKADDNVSPETDNSPSDTKKLVATPIEELRHPEYIVGYKEVYRRRGV